MTRSTRWIRDQSPLPPDHYACVDASRVIRDNDLVYVSDSAMMWRRYTFDSALDEDRNLCLLAHPHSWLHPQNDYVAMIREFESSEVKGVTGRYDAFVNALGNYYTQRLRERILVVLLATLHENEIRQVIRLAGQGDRVVDRLAPLSALEDQLPLRW